jgi:hypothetical protein
MVANDQSLELTLVRREIRKIEHFVDDICDQLFINDTYYGNILMSITELFNTLCEKSPGKTLNIIYNTDYKQIKISTQPIDKEIVKVIESDIDLDNIMDGPYSRNIFLIKSLVDAYEIEEDALILNFDIGALHNEIYKKRADQLQSYFKKEDVKKKQKSGDKL